MNLSPQLLNHANAIIADVYDDLRNLGPVQSFIPPGHHTADFPLGDGQHMLRAKEEKSVVFFHVFRAK